jgi:hypothetical protein
VREAPRPEGPWTERREVFRIPEAARRDAIVYAGKAHPELEAGRDLALTYMSNSSGLGPEIFSDESLYYPRFVRIRQQEP